MTRFPLLRTLFPATLLFVATCHAQSPAMLPVPKVQGVPPAVLQAAETIDPEKIRAHVKFLSSDLLEGRGPGKRGAELAAEYIATQFALDGLKPAGDNRTFYQNVPLYAVHTDEAKTIAAFVPKSGEPIKLTYGSDYVTKDERGETSADLDAPIVFVGYGIVAPEYHWDDYAGVDVKGKVLLVIVNEPPSNEEKFFKGKTMTYYGRWTYKYEEAARHGAAGVLIIHREDLASYPWSVVQNSQAIEKSYLKGSPLATLKAASWIQLEVARKLMDSWGEGSGGQKQAIPHPSLDQYIIAAGKPGFKAFELPVRFQAHIASVVRPYQSANVIGMVPGASTGPAVLYSAHYDHLGIDPDAKGDGIYNGAGDNGTGCGILLELARAFAQSSVKPPHPVYFASVTAEEQGLLGSEYLGMHPPVPAGQIALDLNYDMLNPIGVPTSVEIAGAERTTFYPQVEATANDFDLTIQPDQTPSAGHYYRSDHFSFARVGVPSFSIGQGTLFAGHDAAWGEAQAKDYVEHHYHQPSDEYHPEMDFRGNAKMAQFGMILGWEASESSKPIGWQTGDEFEAARMKSLGGR